MAETAISFPWEKSFDEVGQYLLTAKQPVNYETLFGESSVIFLGDTPINLSIQFELQTQAKALRDAGISALLLEADSSQEELFRQISSGDFSRVSRINFGSRNKEQLIPMLEALQREGIKIVPIDDPKNYGGIEKSSVQERKEFLATKIKEVAGSEAGKIAVFINFGHAIREEDSVIDILEGSGVSCRSVIFTGGMDWIPKVVTESARCAGIAGERFMFLLTGGRRAPYGGGQIMLFIYRKNG